LVEINPISLAKKIKGQIHYAVPMAEYTSFRVGGPVDYLAFPADLEDLRQTVKWCREEKIDYFILGKGTNLLVRDGGIRGMAISLSRGFSRMEEASSAAEESLIFAEAGGALEKLIGFCTAKGLTGLEFAAGIPGTIGGAIAMNAGAFGGEIRQVLQAVRLLGPEGVVAEKKKEELQFSYRSLELKKGEVILAGYFQLPAKNWRVVQNLVEHNLERRKSKQPLDFPSAGSVFKNPGLGPAGRLIEQAGLKGYRIGEAQVSEKHANFIVNRGQARARDILVLVETVREKVFKESGIRLEMEIKVMGAD